MAPLTNSDKQYLRLSPASGIEKAWPFIINPALRLSAIVNGGVVWEDGHRTARPRKRRVI